ncbi:polyketide synthase [Poronia punctata]|nr:polyketide synthase [Poronia punctata]
MAAQNDPSTIVGLACRVPGANNPSQLWESLVQKRDVRSKMPEDRFNVDNFFHSESSNKGTTNARYGYFLDSSIRQFDATFFGISGKEAEAMDPQQRLLLEVVYEALVDAGITLSSISGSQTSVYCGSFTNDYNSMLTKDLESYPKYMVTGTGNAILSNRISYFYDLHGPSVTIDTACSSSLVSFHLANKSLQDGESDISIVVGSALHFDPNIFITMTDLGMLSTDGRCRTFDANGSGYVRGEGICAAILKRQSVAERDGDRIRAIVRATGSNHDGRKQGITLPNSVAQEALIRATYQNAGLDPRDTQYFEAHGTGTQAGDPSETRAIGAVFSSRESPLYVGSVKTNIGHLEGASGLAGIIKATLSLEKGKIPPNMHFETPNPNIDFENWKLSVPQRLLDWKRPGGDGVRRASINSFGYGGTNAHVVLEEYRERELRRSHTPAGLIANGVHARPYLLALTSHSTKAGELLEGTLSDYLKRKAEKGDMLDIADLAQTLSVRRDMHAHRSFLVVNGVADTIENLQTPRPSAPWTVANKSRPRLGFVFTGQGAQWFAMGRQLIQESPLFRQTLQRCDAVLQSLPDAPEWTILDELRRSEEDSKLGETLYSQTICTALQLAIVDLIKTWGITPSAVVGHSSGEMGAAYASGILSFDNAMIAAYYRGRYMSANSDDDADVRGAMMAVGMTESKALEELKPYTGRVTVAAVNSPGLLTLSGDEDGIDELQKSLTERKVFARKLKVKQAFHSHHMFPLAPAYESALRSCKTFVPQAPTCRMFSSVTSRVADYHQMDASYWATNMTHAVRFSDALTGILLDDNDEQAVDALVEIGPHPALKGPSKETAKALKLNVDYVASLQRGTPDFDCLLQMAGQLFSLGYPVDLGVANSNISLDKNDDVVKVQTGRLLEDMPTYTWDHSQFWSETRFIKEHRLRRFRHSVLGHIVPGSIEKHPSFRNYLRLSEISWLSDHVVDGQVVFPAAGYISMAIEAMLCLNESTEIKSVSLKDVVVKAPLIIPDDENGVEVLLELRPVTISAKSKSDVLYEFSVFSYDSAGKCSSHCHGVISTENGTPMPMQPLIQSQSIEALRKATNSSTPASTFYQRLNRIGLEYGDRFRLLSGSVDSGPGFAVSSLSFDPNAVQLEKADTTVVHPSLLDACFHVVFSAIESCLGRGLDEPYVPSFIRSLKFSGLFAADDTSDERRFEVYSRTKVPSARLAISDMSLQGNGGNMMEIEGLEVTALGRELPENNGPRTLFYKMRWLPCFDFLSTSQENHNRDVADAVDIFAHQYPDSRILQLASNVEKVEQTIQHLGAYRGQRRRFKHLDIYNSLGDSSQNEQFDSLVERSNGLISVSEPEEGAYDLIVMTENYHFNFAPYLREGGSVIADGNIQPVLTPDFEEVFTAPRLSAFRKKPNEPAYDGSLVVVMPTHASERTQSILQGIKESWPGAVKATTIQKAIIEARKTSTTTPLVVLSTIAEEPKTASAFIPIRDLVTKTKRPILWALEGATMDSSRPSQSILLGLIRTAKSENEQLDVSTLDFGETSTVDNITGTITRFLQSHVDEDELAERDGCIYIPKVEADDSRNMKLHNGPGQDPVLEPFGERRPLQLTIGKPGLLETLHFQEDEEILTESLKPDEIEIEVRASAINFRDIAVSMGIIDDYKLGDECAGLVTAVGSQVEGFDVGDHVVAWRPGQGAHRALVRNPASLCYKLQGTMSFTNAAALPLILTTAYYALIDVARLQAGETVLIHSAAGGVGQMAVQIAQRIGAKVFVTVGSPAKRELLQNKYGLSEDQMFNSRDDSFVEGIMQATNAQGVDVVLNSLAGPLLHASWACVNAFGRFIEIGKRDIHESTRITMAPFRRNVTFASVDLITMFERNKTLGARVFQECCRMVHEGEIQLPATILELSYADALKGFRMLQMGKHVGKVVLKPNKDDLVPVLPAKFKNIMLFDPSKRYLLVGGLGGIGRLLSQWMVRKGARKLAFLSRSGAEKAEAKATVSWLEERDIEVGIYRGDVSSLSDVRSCVDKIGQDLRGVFHAAMVLQDTALDTMTFHQFSRCLQPKVDGAENLHKATAGVVDLDFFVCFSSVASVLGSKGLGNYSAANAFLDALMRRRREQGLCGTSISVGAVSGVGVVAENANIQKAMERLGQDFISEQELQYQLEEAVKSDSAIKTTRGVDEHQIITGVGLVKPDVYWASKPLFRNLYANHDFGTAEDSTTVSLMGSLAEESDPERKTEILLDAFIEKIAQILATPRDTILPGNTLSAYGLDSIVAVEFRKWFRKEVQVDIALFDILGAQSIQSLIEKVVKMIPEASQPASQNDTKKPTQESPDEVAEVVEDGPKSESLEEIPRQPDAEVIPLSSYQSRLWFLHSFLPDKSTLNLPIVMRMSGTPDRHSLRQAVQELVMRNPAFRTAYFEGDDFTQQLPVEDFDIDLPMRDLSSSPDPERALQEYVSEAKSTELNIEEGEVIHWSLVKLAHDSFAFVWIMHHISTDRGNMKSVMSQLSNLYDAIRENKDLAAVPAPKLSYADFTLWHNEYLKSQGMKKHLDWWKSNLSGIPESSKLLPFTKSERPTQGNSDRAIVRASLDSKLFSRMKRLTSQANGTPYHFVLAAFRAFMHRYTQDDDLVVLAVDGNRPHPDAEDIAGFFVNMCPIRCQDDCETSFDELLNAVRDRAIEAMSHSAVPFDVIVDLMNVKKTSNYSPIGQVAVNYQIHGPAPRYETKDFVIDQIDMEDIPTSCDLSLEALETANGGLNLRLEYATALYGSENMDRFIDNFLTFLSSCIRDHRQPVDQIEICGPLELSLLESRYWNHWYKAPTWAEPTVMDRIAELSRWQPKKTAIQTSNGQNVPYGELVASSRYIAAALHEAGVKRGDRVGILAYPGIGAITGILGTILSGACYMALDVDFARDRLSFMMEDAASKVLLVGPGTESLAKELVGKSNRDITVIGVTDAVKQRRLPKSLPTREANDPFYMIYTSGSTGAPKGVTLTESNTLHMLSSLHDDYNFTNEDCFLQQSSMSFDLSVVQIFSALTAGAEVAIASWETRKDPSALADFMAKKQVTVTYFTPTQFSLLMETNPEALKRCSRYRVAFFAGERLPVRVAKGFHDLGTPASLYNTWSPSEVVVQTTVAKIDYPTDEETNLPIGHPLNNCRHYILDAKRHPVPLGHVGEIYVGGAQVGAGYLNRPDSNLKSFFENPFCSQEDRERGWTRIFKTGDRGSFREDGQLEFHGRIAGDKQIKLRGFRIDLGEVENRIFEEVNDKVSPGLADISVVPRERDDDSGDVQLVAFQVPKRELDEEKQVEFVTAANEAIEPHLNDYMRPDGYQFLDEMPTTIGGKVDRQDLLNRDLDLVQPSSEPSDNQVPEAKTDAAGTEDGMSEIQRDVLDIFQGILGAGRYTSLTDNFFDKGGSSILLVRLQSKIRRKYKTAPALTEMMRDPSASSIVSFIDSNVVNHDSGYSDSGDVLLSWSEETKLPQGSSYRPQHGAHRVNRADISGILITGPESNIGIHLLGSLLQRHRAARIYLLGGTEPIDIEDLVGTLVAYRIVNSDLTADEVLRRVEVVDGTLNEPRFGMSKSDFRALGEAVQSIYHLASEVSLLKTYSLLKQSNVSPVLDLLRLARTGDYLSEIHYLSTWSVPHLQTWKGSSRTQTDVSAAEEEMSHFQPPTTDELGYFKTRWVAESLLTEAASRGFPITITRASAVTSSTSVRDSSKDVHLDEFTLGIVMSMVEKAAVPQLGSSALPPFSIDFIPVEYLVAALVTLTAHERKDTASSMQKKPEIYHIGNPAALQLLDLPAIVKEIRPEIEEVAEVSLEDWLATVGEKGGDEQTDAAGSVISTVLKEYFPRGHVMFSLDRTNTSKALNDLAPGLEQTCPAVDADLLGQLWHQIEESK